MSAPYPPLVRMGQVSVPPPASANFFSARLSVLPSLHHFYYCSPSVGQSRIRSPCNKSERFIASLPGRPQRQSIMRLCGIRGKDYISTSNDVRELPDFFKFASTDSLVTPSNAPDGIGFPISHLGSAFLAASKNAFRYARSYCCMVYPANRSFFCTLRCKFVYTSDRFVVSPKHHFHAEILS